MKQFSRQSKTGYYPTWTINTNQVVAVVLVELRGFPEEVTAAGP